MKKSTLLKLRQAKEEYLLDALGGVPNAIPHYLRKFHLSNLKQEYYSQYFNGAITEEQFAEIAYPMPLSKKEKLSIRLAQIERTISCAFENNVTIPTEWMVERNDIITMLNNA